MHFLANHIRITLRCSTFHVNPWRRMRAVGNAQILARIQRRKCCIATTCNVMQKSTTTTGGSSDVGTGVNTPSCLAGAPIISWLIMRRPAVWSTSCLHATVPQRCLRYSASVMTNSYICAQCQLTVCIELVCNITNMCKLHCVSNSDCVWIITKTATYTWTAWRIPLEVFPAEYVTQSMCTICTGYNCLFIHRQNTDRRIRRCRWSCTCHADLDTIACYRRHSWAARPLSTARTAHNDCTHIQVFYSNTLHTNRHMQWIRSAYGS